MRKQIPVLVFSGSCVFFLWGYVKEQVFVSPLPPDIDGFELKIAAVIETTDRDVLKGVWDELEYRLNICRVTNGTHIERLQGM
jgi:hypothetical protein